MAKQASPIPSSFQNLIDLAEGKFNIDDVRFFKPQSPTFVKMIVLEVVSDPSIDNSEAMRSKWEKLGVSNIDLAGVLPRNTVVAKRVGENTFPMFLFPFFPSHLSLPCKPGECVWVMFDDPESNRQEIGYWFCRVVDLHTSDDVNHSHPGRAVETSMYPSTKQVAEAEQEGTAESGENVWHELRNGPVINFADDRHTAQTNNILRDVPEDIFERLITETAAASLSIYETVPRFRKRPGDVVLEGSNNTLLVLGADREGSPLLGAFTNEAGAVDIVAGRGYTPETLGIEADTTSIKDAKGKTKGTPLKKELNKSPSVLSPIEGDPDFRNDRSRILISQRTNVDGKFGLAEYNTAADFSSDTTGGDAAIVIKSDKVRLIARSDLEMVVTNYTVEEIPDRLARKDEEVNLDSWASIVIKSTGDIIFKPSKLGYIKLGGEDADKGIVCSDAAVSAVDGNVSGPALVTTMGGFFAGAVAGDGDNTPALAAGQAKFANKVLIK